MIILCLIIFDLLICLLVFKPQKQQNRAVLYKCLHLNKTSKTFIFAKNLVFKNPKNIIFYAEIGGVFYIILGQNSFVKVELKQNGVMHKINANPCFVRANCAQNQTAYYQTTKLHTTQNFEGEVFVSFVGVQFFYNKTKHHFEIKAKNTFYRLNLFGQLDLKSCHNHIFEFVFKNIDIDYASFNFFDIKKPERNDFLLKNFGFFDTSSWHNLKDFSMVFDNKPSLQKNYFLEKTNPTNCVVKTLRQLDDSRYLEVKINSYFILLNSKKIKIDIKSFGFGEVVVLSYKKNILKLEDLISGFVCFFRFGKLITRCSLGKVFGTMFVYAELKGICCLEILPFDKHFDISLFLNPPIKKFVSNKNVNIQSLKPNIPFGLCYILDMLNYHVVCGLRVDVLGYLKNLNPENMDSTAQFKYLNLMLSLCVASNKDLFGLIRKYVLLPLKNLKLFSKSEVFCFLNKLIIFVNNERLKNFLKYVLEIYKPNSMQNFEYLFCYVLGVQINNGILSVKSPQIECFIELEINHVLLQIKTTNKNCIVVDGIEYINNTSINLFAKHVGNILIECSKQN